MSNEARPDYFIHFKDLSKGQLRPNKVGIEVRPPVVTEVFNSIRRLLTQDPSAYHVRAQHASDVIRTRQDKKGTAFTVFATSWPDDPSEKIAHVVGQAIDPCGINVIEYVSHNTE